MSDTVGRKPPAPKPAPVEFTLMEFSLLVAVGLAVCGGALLGYSAVRDNARVDGEAWAMTQEELADRARVRAQQVRNNLHFAAAEAVVAKAQPKPNRPRPVYAEVRTIEEVNTWCAGTRYDWKLFSAPGDRYGSYILVRTEK